MLAVTQQVLCSPARTEGKAHYLFLFKWMKVSLLFQTQPPGKAFEPQTIHHSLSPTVHSRKAAARWAGLERVFSSYFAAIWKDAVLSGAQVKRVKEGGHPLLPVEVAPICSPPWRCCPECWLGPRWGVFHWDGGHWERSQVPTRVWWVLDVMNLKGHWDIWAEQTHKPRDTVLMNGSWINVQEMLTCSQIACPGTDFLRCYCPLDQGFHRFHS